MIQYSLDQAAQICGIQVTVIVQYIQNEWILPCHASEDLTLLDDEDLARTKLISDLREDLGVNDEAIPIILHLIDQLILRNQVVEKLKHKMHFAS